ncbi:hypothetical protein Bbelb_068670 [Branchiostoma belcheri]|nr:hypothetical protein Bbelb_068670 [Branchiostoma belcheri]
MQAKLKELKLCDIGIYFLKVKKFPNYCRCLYEDYYMGVATGSVTAASVRVSHAGLGPTAPARSAIRATCTLSRPTSVESATRVMVNISDSSSFTYDVITPLHARTAELHTTTPLDRTQTLHPPGLERRRTYVKRVRAGPSDVPLQESRRLHGGTPPEKRGENPAETAAFSRCPLHHGSLHSGRPKAIGTNRFTPRGGSWEQHVCLTRSCEPPGGDNQPSTQHLLEESRPRRPSYWAGAALICTSMPGGKRTVPDVSPEGHPRASLWRPLAPCRR